MRTQTVRDVDWELRSTSKQPGLIMVRPVTQAFSNKAAVISAHVDKLTPPSQCGFRAKPDYSTQNAAALYKCIGKANNHKHTSQGTP